MGVGAPQCLRIAFLHPDLGLGGAERLVVDAAAELAARGHHVDMYTAYYDPARCFDETRSGAFSVRVAGGWFPRALAGRAVALCALARCALVALRIAADSARGGGGGGGGPYDAVFVDQVAGVLPLLRLLLPRSTRLLFYCHFPDLLLSTQRRSLAKRVYRAPLDWLEETATGTSDALLVNSRFTASVFAATFTRLAARGVVPQVLYPCVAVPPADTLAVAATSWRSELDADLVAFVSGGPMLLSINRFERKKGIGLAIAALHELLQREEGSRARLVVAGGYDVRLAENREHLEELKEQAAALKLQERVRFVTSFTDRQRALLLAACHAVVYTPQHEHFGIVPLEAMAAERPVVACNNGGPTESVLDGSTGLLCEPTAVAFAGAYACLLAPGAAEGMGGAARAHVQQRFSRSAFGEQLEGHLWRMVQRRGGA